MLKDVELYGRGRNDCSREPPVRMRLRSLSLNEPGIRTIMPSPGGWKLRGRKIESATLQWVGWATGIGEGQLPTTINRPTQQAAHACHSIWFTALCDVGTILILDGWRVMIYTRDHGPAHVHLVSPEARIKVWLNCPSGPLEPYEARGVTKATLRRLLETLESNLNRLCSEWRKVHGDL